MKKTVASLFLFYFFAVQIAPAINAAEDDYLPYIDEEYGKILLDMRWRYEHVDQDNVDDADAVTIRTRWGYQTPTYFGFTGLVEMEHNVPFNSGTYTAPGVTSFRRSTRPAVLQGTQRARCLALGARRGLRSSSAAAPGSRWRSFPCRNRRRCAPQAVRRRSPLAPAGARESRTRCARRSRCRPKGPREEQGEPVRISRPLAAYGPGIAGERRILNCPFPPL